jgi:hypothetical protein
MTAARVVPARPPVSLHRLWVSSSLVDVPWLPSRQVGDPGTPGAALGHKAAVQDRVSVLPEGQDSLKACAGLRSLDPFFIGPRSRAHVSWPTMTA